MKGGRRPYLHPVLRGAEAAAGEVALFQGAEIEAPLAGPADDGGEAVLERRPGAGNVEREGQREEFVLAAVPAHGGA